MKLSSTTTSFQLSVIGYGINPTNWRDRNCLRCEVATRWLKQHDIQTVPLQTWEVNRLITSLQSLWNRLTTHVTLTFAEPGLSFEASVLAEDRYRVRIQLDHSLTPTWHSYPDFPLELTLQLNRRQLREIIRDLTCQLSNYPER